MLVIWALTIFGKGSQNELVAKIHTSYNNQFQETENESKQNPYTDNEN